MLYCRQGLFSSLRILALLYSETAEGNLTDCIFKREIPTYSGKNSVAGHKPCYCNGQMLTTICLIKALEMAAPPLKSRLTTTRLLTPTSSLRLPKPGWGDFGDEILEHKKSPCHSPSDWFFAQGMHCMLPGNVKPWDTRHTGTGHLWKTVLQRAQICCNELPYGG